MWEFLYASTDPHSGATLQLALLTALLAGTDLAAGWRGPRARLAAPAQDKRQPGEESWRGPRARLAAPAQDKRQPGEESAAGNP